jgi:hypothetical protein
LSPRGRPASVGDGARRRGSDASPSRIHPPPDPPASWSYSRVRRDKRLTDLGERRGLPDAPSASARHSRPAQAAFDPLFVRQPFGASREWRFSVAAGWVCADSHPSVDCSHLGHHGWPPREFAAPAN